MFSLLLPPPHRPLASSPRPPGDIVYTEDDVMSPADYAAGFRRWAPPSPSQAGTGHFMAQAGSGRGGGAPIWGGHRWGAQG